MRKMAFGYGPPVYIAIYIHAYRQIYSHPFKDIMADPAPQINVFFSPFPLAFPLLFLAMCRLLFCLPQLFIFSASLHSFFVFFFLPVFYPFSTFSFLAAKFLDHILEREMEKWACAAHKFAFFFSKEICHFNLPNLLRKIAKISHFPPVSIGTPLFSFSLYFPSYFYDALSHDILWPSKSHKTSKK